MNSIDRASWSYSVLREAITSGVFAPGERLVEGRLAEQLGVSRAPLREALVRLETTGLLARNKYGFAFVTRLSVSELQEIFFVRKTLEKAAVRLACGAPDKGRRHLLAQLASLLDEEAQLLSSPKRSHQLKVNQRFHASLWKMGGNEHLNATLLGNVDRVHAVLASSPHDIDNLRRSHEEHLELLDLIEARDANRAAELLVMHLEGTMQNIIRSLEQGEADKGPLQALAASMKKGNE